MARIVVNSVTNQMPDPDPSTCEHKWISCLTPADSGHKWYRCKKCGCFGHPKRPASWGCRNSAPNIIIPYRCSRPKCKKPAIDRDKGRGPRCSFKWKCRDHARQSSE